jgi:hypothetical protein
MRPIQSIFSDNKQLYTLTEQLQSHQNLQAFWQAGAPAIIAKNSFAANIQHTRLLIYANNAMVANKIKLNQANLLMQLQNLQKTNASYKEYQVSALLVKVQVISATKTSAKSPKKLSLHAADQLNELARRLGDSPLSQQLMAIAKKAD